MMFKNVFLIILIFLIINTINAQGLKNCKPNKYYKHLNVPGFLMAYHYPGNRIELGVSKVLSYRERKAITNVSVVKYKPPFLLEAALSSELAILPKFYIGPQLSGWITPFSFKSFKLTSFFGKVGFHTLGHIIVGTNFIYYMDFAQPAFNFRPEIGIYNVFKIKNLLQRSFYLMPRVTYGNNRSSKVVQNYPIGTHQLSVKMTIYWKRVGK